VNDSVRNEYEQEYHIPLKVIRNVPVSSTIIPATLPEHWKNKIILLAQGAGLNEGRSCIEMIDALPLLDDIFHLVFIGGGNAWEKLKKKRKEMQLEHRIDMMEKMLPSKLKSFTPLAHLGMSLDNFTDKNFLYNLPNKIFDYMQAGVPVFATAIPEVKRIIDQYDCGITISDTSPQHIAKVITELMNDENRYARLKANALSASREFCWEKEQVKLRAIYQDFL
ncbi:MAG TPA: glycosyltransferase, partial [Ginsengibacter sp.]|nr:glycosyltransferase [Ginsengibacter sp.]